MSPNLSKTVAELIKRLAQIIKFTFPKEIVRKDLTTNYDVGVQEVEAKIDFNLQGDPRKIGFLEDYAFDNVKGMSEELAEKMRKELSQALMNNESLEKIRKRIAQVMEVGEQRAKAIARTETNRARNAGTLDGAQEAETAGLKTKKWLLITYDSRTSDISKAMGAKYGSPKQAIPLDKDFKVQVNGKTIQGPHPPFHVNDRDRLMIEVTQ